MTRAIRITAGAVTVNAELNDTETADTVWDALPIQANGSTWGDEIYFKIPVYAGLEDGQEVVELGDLGYWPPGQAFCLFFGLTPASQGDEIRPASAVTVIGKILDDTEPLKSVASGSAVLIEPI
ncbi:MAG: hypothetical protein CL732_02770 [Chloroflexi bacterium]|nr:hypothetical protein [Chloroflexota bacterium]